jgi:Tol biopolymer transport system component
MPDTHEDIRRRLFDAAWEPPAYAPAPERTLVRARRRAALTIFGGGAGALVVALVAIIIAAGSAPRFNDDQVGIDGPTQDPGEYLVDATTGERTEFAELPRGAWLYDISPDGSALAFVSDTSGRNQVWVMDMNGSDLRRLTDDPYEATDPAWSPDGSKLVFVGLGGGTTRRLFTVDVDSSRVTRLPWNASHLRSAGDVWNPDWSPDSERILFHTWVGGEPAAENPYEAAMSLQVRSLEIDTGRVSVVAGGKRVAAWDGSWSDSGRIAFIRGTPDEPLTRPRLWTMDGDGSAAKSWPLVDAEDAISPVWSPDGQRIAYTRAQRGTFSIHVLDLAAGEDRRVATGAYAQWVDEDMLLVQEFLPEH